MANLFFIHTPFQLFVAQQLIAQEALVNNIMVYGYIGENKHTLSIYDTMIVDSMWSSRYFMERINDWDIFQIKHPLHSYKLALNNRFFLEKLIKENNVKYIYVGDINNTCYQLLMLYYKSADLKFNVFEEGSSHYVNPNQASLFRNPIIGRLQAILNNLLYYLPLWHRLFAGNLYIKHLEYRQLPINERYSICPYYNEPYDKIIKPRIIMSEKTKAYVDNELKGIDTHNSVLFLSEPVDECTALGSKLEILTLKKELEQLDGCPHIIIKFHPRENEMKRNEILKVFKELSCPHTVICRDVNLPIEYFLQLVPFRKIFTYFCSTVFYNGYLFHRTAVQSMLPTYYEYCLRNKSDFTDEIRMFLNSESYNRLFNNDK